MKKKVIIIFSLIIIGIIVFLSINYLKKINTPREKEAQSTAEQTEGSFYQEELSEEQIKKLEDAGVDTTSTYYDARFPDGTSMFEWSCKNDREYIKIHYPDEYKKCLKLENVDQLPDEGLEDW